MKNLLLSLRAVLWAILFLQCSGSSFEEQIAEDNYQKPFPAVTPEEEPAITLNDLGYAYSSNATLVVRQIDDYEGSQRQAEYLDGFLGQPIPNRDIATSDSTRILLDPDGQRGYVLYPNENFTILGFNGIERENTVNLPFLGDNWVTELRIDYQLDGDEIILSAQSSPFTPCPDEGWGWVRRAQLSFRGNYNEILNAWEGNFTWSENGNELGQCILSCRGKMSILLDSPL